jgi:hypothetical protein
MATSHAVLADSHEVTVPLKFIGECTVQKLKACLYTYNYRKSNCLLKYNMPTTIDNVIDYVDSDFDNYNLVCKCSRSL